MNETIVITKGASQEEFQKFLAAIEKRTNDAQPKNKTEWIDITPETMPPADRAIHIAVKLGKKIIVGMFSAVYHNGEFFGTTMSNDVPGTIELHRVNGEVTHWMLWPDPPEA